MMNWMKRLRSLWRKEKPGKRVALVLSGGGARGIAHIGAIEELQARGYEIASVAGTSMGAMVGGALAAGKLEELKREALSMKRARVLGLIDLSLGLDHVVGGKKVMQLLKRLLGDMRIEDTEIPFCCCASDLTTGQERVFRSGSLCSAIRASISIPGLFKPENLDGHSLVDGSVHNTLPLDRVERNEGDILVAVNVSAANDYGSLPGKGKSAWSENHINLAAYIMDLMVTVNTQMSLRLTPPDVLVNVPTNYCGLFEFDKAKQIIEYGRQEMRKQLDAYEASLANN